MNILFPSALLSEITSLLSSDRVAGFFFALFMFTPNKLPSSA
jgi:hypothetical protein